MAFELIGKVGPYDTKAEVDAKILVETERAKAAEMALQHDIDDNAGKTAELDADLTMAKNRISDIESVVPENASESNKLATIDDIQTTGGLTQVEHDESLKGRGTNASPLGLSESTKDEIASKADQTVVAALDNTVSGIQSDYVSKTATETQTISGPITITGELCVADTDGTAKHSLAIVAGIPTETAEEMDIVGARKFDELPTTDDTTTYDDLNPQKLITKGQISPVLTALDEKVDLAATSGTLVGSYWFGKTNASAEVPAPTLPGQNYYDFTTGQVYKSADGTTWTLDMTYTPPTDKDVQIGITSKFWDIAEQENQHGGVAKWSHTDSDWAYYPQMYESKPAGASLPILTRMISDHQFNDVSYLNANTFSWQSGSMYVAAYQHLVDESVEVPQTITIEGITITYSQAEDGHRICQPDQEDAISQLYAKTGEANFFILDTENARFKLPRTQKRKLIRAVKGLPDKGWYNLYSDGWVEQGGFCNMLKEPKTINLFVPMADKNYDVIVSATRGSANNDIIITAIAPDTLRTTTSIVAYDVTTDNKTVSYQSYSADWVVYGYANASVLANEPVQYEYYYVGNFERSAIEQTAGINAEQFNSKVDIDLQNVSDDGKVLIANQAMPSDRYIDLTLGASGSTYTAPANGWYTICSKNDGSYPKSIELINASSGSVNTSATAYNANNSGWLRCLLPVKKGDVVECYYVNMSMKYFRFVYAQGSK